MRQGLFLVPRGTLNWYGNATFHCDSIFFPYFLNRRSVAVENRMDTDIMTIREVAGYLKLTEKTAYRLAADGKIPGFKVGGAWRFRRSEIDKWIEQQSTEIKRRGARG